MNRVRGPLRGRAWKVGWALALSLGVGACHYTPTGPVQRDPQVIEDLTFDPSLNVDLGAMTKLPEGVYIQDVTPGVGDSIADLDFFDATVTLKLYDATPIYSDSATFHAKSSSCTSATDCVIDGFRIGMLGMKVGGSRRMLIPPELGYGLFDQYDNSGNLVIPGGSVLIFDVDLASIN